MEGSYGSYTDKTRVYDIKPLRTLKPVFPSGNQAPPPFVCSPPFGPFPPGFSPFYPFTSSSSQPHTTPDLNHISKPPLVTPLRSFRSPDSNIESQEGPTVKRKTPKKQRTPPENVNFESGISVSEREYGNRKLVMSVLRRYEALRRRFSQLEDAREAVSGINKRADLKAVTYSESFKLTQPSFGCDCISSSCKPGNLNCHCIRKNGGDYPYVGNGVLVSRKGMSVAVVHLVNEATPKKWLGSFELLLLVATKSFKSLSDITRQQHKMEAVKSFLG
ncbi:unnamed protein product [Eruca vesicaria subsp. sativa]|uniref:Uncharacterized protein n=1 Tax=Eruca vesicaria subsp. sativa TaxID=29727 RepID=A0ABC8JE93_ERUVS|nr:unnamed protein product [Eruca vesicaria subsp. sativa]